MQVARLVFVAVLLSLGSMGAVTAAPMVDVEEEATPLPAFDAVEAVVRATLVGDERNGDRASPSRLLTRKDVSVVFPALADLGWEVASAAEITERFLSDSDPLVRELRGSPEFARKIAEYPNVYDRLDRLRRMPYGMRRVHEFATTKGGHDMLKYMTSTKGGANLQRQLSRGRNGEDFDQPTGRLYTQDDFLKSLRAAHDEATGVAKKDVRGR